MYVRPSFCQDVALDSLSTKLIEVFLFKVKQSDSRIPTILLDEHEKQQNLQKVYIYKVINNK